MFEERPTSPQPVASAAPSPPTRPAPFARRGWLLALLLPLLMLGLSFWEGLAGLRGIDGASLMPHMDALYQPSQPNTSPVLGRDATPALYNQPWDTVAMRSVLSGQLPLWQSHNGFGMPLLGSGQAAPFHPFKLLFVNGATGAAMAWFLVLRLALGAIGMLLLMRRLGLGPWGGALATMAFTLNGTFLYHFHYSDVTALVMLPWLLLAGERLLAAPTLRNTALLGLAIGLTGHLGHPEPAVFAAAAAMITVALGGLARWGSGARRIFAALALAGVLGVGLAAATVMPFLELVRQSSSYILDNRGLFDEQSWTFVRKIQAMLAQLISPRTTDAFYFNTYVGVIALGLAPLGLAEPRVRRLVATLLLTVGAVILACPPGQHLEVLPAAVKAYYAVALLSMAVALLGGAGLDRLVAKPGGRRAIAAGLCFMALVAIGLAMHFYVRQPAVHLYFRGDFKLAIGVAGAAALGLMALWRWPGLRTGLLLAVAAIELILAARAANPPQPLFTYPETPILSYLKAQSGHFRVAGGWNGLLPHTNAMYGLDSLETLEVFHSRRYIAFLGALYGAPPPLRTIYTIDPQSQPDLLDLANVRYMLVKDDGSAPARYPVVARQAGLALLENQTVMPRAWVAHAADFIAPDAEAAGRRLAATPARWRNRALVETSDGRAPAGWADHALPPGPARIVSRRASELVIEATLPEPGWLVVAEAYYPGWRAEVDGEPAAIYPADAALRAVMLPAGTHRVVFRYDSPVVATGFALSLVALLSILGMIGVRRRRGPLR